VFTKCGENHAKHVNLLSGQNTEFMLKQEC